MSELSNEPTLNDQIGTLAGDTPLSGDNSPLGEVTFSNSGPTSVGTGVMPADPMAKLHITPPKVTTTVQTTGGDPSAPVASSGSLPENGNTSGLISFARKFLGIPYVWGGTQPTGFDCSGLVQYVYKHALGVNLPRLAADQARAGKRISLKDLRPGDLVAWDNSPRANGADHIAIYIGNGQIIEAPRPGLSVRVSQLTYDLGEAWGVRLNLPGRGGGSRPINPTANKPHGY